MNFQFVDEHEKNNELVRTNATGFVSGRIS